MLKDFCLDKTDCKNTVTVAQNIGNEYVLFLSVLVKEPDFRFGIFSRDTGRLVCDIELSDEVLAGALKMLNVKYAFNTTRESPVENPEIACAWAVYLQNRPHENRIPLD